jgi:addiction module HigA family antidote
VTEYLNPSFSVFLGSKAYSDNWDAIFGKRGDTLSRVPSHRVPTHPGVILAVEFLAPFELTQTALAERMGVPVEQVGKLIAGECGVTAEIAELLSKALGTSAEFWVNLQTSFDLAVLKGA